MRSTGTQVAAGVFVRIYVDRAMLQQLVCMHFGPLCRSQQSRFLTIPGGIDERAFRVPALLVELAQGACLLDQRGLATDWVVRAIPPPLIVVAPDDPGV